MVNFLLEIVQKALEAFIIATVQAKAIRLISKNATKRKEPTLRPTNVIKRAVLKTRTR